MATPPGDRAAATAGIALAGVGCSAIAAVASVGFIILCVVAYFLFQILRGIFSP